MSGQFIFCRRILIIRMKRMKFTCQAGVNQPLGQVRALCAAACEMWCRDSRVWWLKLVFWWSTTECRQLYPSICGECWEHGEGVPEHSQFQIKPGLSTSPPALLCKLIHLDWGSNAGVIHTKRLEKWHHLLPSSIYFSPFRTVVAVLTNSYY